MNDSHSDTDSEDDAHTFVSDHNGDFGSAVSSSVDGSHCWREHTETSFEEDADSDAAESEDAAVERNETFPSYSSSIYRVSADSTLQSSEGEQQINDSNVSSENVRVISSFDGNAISGIEESIDGVPSYSSDYSTSLLVNQSQGNGNHLHGDFTENQIDETPLASNMTGRKALDRIPSLSSFRSSDNGIFCSDESASYGTAPSFQYPPPGGMEEKSFVSAESLPAASSSSSVSGMEQQAMVKREQTIQATNQAPRATRHQYQTRRIQVARSRSSEDSFDARPIKRKTPLRSKSCDESFTSLGLNDLPVAQHGSSSSSYLSSSLLALRGLSSSLSFDSEPFKRQPQTIQDQIAVYKTVAMKKAALAVEKKRQQQEEAMRQQRQLDSRKEETPEQKAARIEVVNRLAAKVSRRAQSIFQTEKTHRTIIELPLGGLDGGSSLCVVHEGEPHTETGRHFQHHHHPHGRHQHPLCIKVVRQDDKKGESERSMEKDLPILLLRLEDTLEGDLELGSPLPLPQEDISTYEDANNGPITKESTRMQLDSSTSSSSSTFWGQLSPMANFCLIIGIPLIGIVLILVAVLEITKVT